MTDIDLDSYLGHPFFPFHKWAIPKPISIQLENYMLTAIDWLNMV